MNAMDEVIDPAGALGAPFGRAAGGRGTRIAGAVAAVGLLLGGCAGDGLLRLPDGAGDDDTTAAPDDDATGDDDDTTETTAEPPLEHVPDAGSLPWIPPLCHVSLDCEAVLDEPKQPCRLAIEDAAGGVLYEGWAGVELRGRSSVGYPKSQYSVELWEGGLTLLEAGASWRYLDGGVDPGNGWTAPGFDDSGWATGPAPLGYGGAELTTIGYGPDAANRHVTSWFRATFEIGAPVSGAPLTLSLRRDDGAIVYLNGVEVARTHLPDGAVTADTLATDEVEGQWEVRFLDVYVDPALVAVGANVLAVELHQVDPSSADLLLDAWLGDVGSPVGVNFYEMGQDSDWILNGNYCDRALFRNKLSFDLYQALGGPERYATETVLCELTRDGEWLGVYTLGERIKRDDDRVVLAEDPDDLGGSFIVKLDDAGGWLLPSAAAYGGWFLVYPRADEISAQAEAGVREALAAMEAAALSDDPADPDTGLFAHVDLDSAVDWVLLQELSKNNDAYFLSIHLARDLGGPIRFIPWDLDLAWGGYPVDYCGPDGWVAWRPPLIGAMSEVPAFRQRLVERWTELRADLLSDDAMAARLDHYFDTLGDAAYANFEVWPMEDIEFSWDGIDWLCPMDSYDAERVHLHSWVQARLAWMDAHIAAY